MHLSKCLLSIDRVILTNLTPVKLFHNLSQKQINLASDAVSRGYFDIPKKISIEELAESNSISKSTLQEHLSKAESKIFRSIESYLRLYETYLEAQEKASDDIQQ